MTIQEAMQRRHSVRRYLDRAIGEELLDRIRSEIDACSDQGGLSIRLITDEEKAFSSPMARYGSFSGVRNYILLSGKKKEDLEERVGYYGERIVLFLQQLGLNTCWVGLTYNRRLAKGYIATGETLVCALAFGYGETQGKAHRNKPLERLCRCSGTVPEWFEDGMKAALLVPTAVNRQGFFIELDNGALTARAAAGAYGKVDLGIVKYHFEIGAGKDFPGWSA